MYHALVFLPVLLSLFGCLLRPHKVEDSKKSEEIQLEKPHLNGVDNKDYQRDL